MTGTPIDRAEAMLDRSRIGRAPQRVDGYLDLVGAAADEASTLSLRLMNTPALAALYEKAWRPAFTRLFSLGGTGTLSRQEVLLDTLTKSGDRRVLDVGCGPGLYTRPLADKLTGAGLAVGLDLSAPMLRRAVRDNSGPQIAYVRGSALEIPFADNTFDTVVCLAALYLIPEPRQAVSEIVRVTAPGATVAIFTSLRTSLTALVGPATEKITGFRWFGRDEITGWLRDEGVENVEQTISGQGQFVTGVVPLDR